MAKLTVEMDTESKTLEVSIDGNKIENAKNVSVWMDDDYGYLEVSEYEKSDNGVSKVTRYSASANDKFSEEDKPDTKALASVLFRRDMSQ